LSFTSTSCQVGWQRLKQHRIDDAEQRVFADPSASVITTMPVNAGRFREHSDSKSEITNYKANIFVHIPSNWRLPIAIADCKFQISNISNLK